MAVTSLGERYKECFYVSCPIGVNISLTFFTISRIKSQCSDNQVCPYKCPSCVFDQCGTVDTAERGGPSNLSEKFSNGTSTMDINDKYFDDPDSDDEVNKLLLRVSTMLAGLLLILVMVIQK
ncbi:hypothetical protein Adt_35416 [Abeliophyllum distichum]|uniref:Uncharacterized protein n=1 Tax=Abeliophyllum distichum TaxID=126358 RepID=A0ABD1QEP9_9LAMI